MKKTTLKDVASAAGVSVGMASRVLGNYGYYSQETKFKVLEAARKVEYRPNTIAKALKVRHTKVIGVVISDIANTFFPTVVRAIEDSAHKSGYHVILCNTDEDPVKAREYLDALYERSVDGMVISPSQEIQAQLRKLAGAGLPIVLVDRFLKGLKVPTVTVDNREGSYQAVSYLIEKGHRRIGCLSGLAGISTSDERLAGYLQALEEHGIDPDEEMIESADFRQDKAAEAAGKLLDHESPPTALFVCNETMAMGALRVLRERKITVGKDLAFISFGDPDWASLMHPALSTVRQPTYAIGTLACQQLIALLTRPDRSRPQAEHVVLKTELVIRESC
jgi:DNA-binding LacI/PurR family transcriptional regulator